MTPLGYLREGEYVHPPRVTMTANLDAFRDAIIRAGVTFDIAADSFTRFARAVSRRRKQVEGVSYGNPQLIHRGRKPTARRKARP